MPPPLSQIKAVIAGQTKMQLVKILKKTTFKQFLVFFRYLTVKPQKTISSLFGGK